MAPSRFQSRCRARSGAVSHRLEIETTPAFLHYPIFGPESTFPDSALAFLRSVDNSLEQAAEWPGEFRRRLPCDESDATGRAIGDRAVIERVVGNRDIAPDTRSIEAEGRRGLDELKG